MNHPEIIRLIIAYTFVGAIVFTTIITCLSLVGWIKLADRGQQRKLFNVLIVELIVGAVALFFDWATLKPAEVARTIEARGIEEADLTLARQTAEAVVKDRQARQDPGAPLESFPPPPIAATLTASTSDNAGMIRLLVDGESKATGDGAVTANVSWVPGRQHIVAYVIRGTPGSQFTVEVSGGPPELAVRETGTLDANGAASGVRVVDVPRRR